MARMFTILTITACSDTAPVEPRLAPVDAPALARAADPTGCVSPATSVVFTDAQLHYALLSAQPGDVIAISGIITLTKIAQITTRGVTVTCAAAGDGLKGRPGGNDLIWVLARDVRLQGLLIDAWPSFGTPIRAQRTGGTTESSRTRNLQAHGNHIRCNTNCMFVIGVKHTIITDNTFETNATIGGGTGIHVQQAPVPDPRPDSLRIERNVLIAHQPTGSPVFGAIRPRDGHHVVIRDNQIIGPWANAIALAELHNSVIEGNTAVGVRQHGLMIGGNAAAPISVTGLLIRDNTFTTTGTAAIRVDRACGNLFLANKLEAPIGGAKVFFTASTGRNVFLGQSSTVVDNGAKDCDGDGIADPNFVSGGSKGGSEPPGPVISEVIDNSHELQ